MAKKIWVTVLYEDKRGKTNQFGLHKFVTACVFDQINGLRHLVEKSLEARPLNGNTTLFHACRNDVDLIERDGRKVMAIFDDDQIRRLLKDQKSLPKTDCRALLCEAIRQQKASPIIVLLVENAETVLRVIQSNDPELSPELAQRAIQRKDHAARDAMFDQTSTAKKQVVREAVLQQMPSLARLVSILGRLLQDKATPEPNE